MHLANRSIAFAGLFLFLVAGAAHCQDDRSLIDDLPKERKEAAKSESKRPGKPQAASRRDGDAADSPPEDILPRVPGKSPPSKADRTTLIDDRAERREAERNAAKAANAIPDTVTLADALAQALRNSPLILVAEAKVGQAQAELNEVRLSVTHDVALAFQRRTSNKTVLAVYEEEQREGRANNRQAIEKLRQAILEDESRIAYLLGVGSNTGPRRGSASARDHDFYSAMFSYLTDDVSDDRTTQDGEAPVDQERVFGHRSPDGRTGTRSKPIAPAKGLPFKAERQLPESLQKFLQSRVDFDFAEQPLTDVCDYLLARTEAHVGFVWKEPRPESKVTLTLKDVTVEAGLQALADLTECGFVFRDYGILVVGPMDAAEYATQKNGPPMIAPGEYARP